MGIGSGHGRILNKLRYYAYEDKSEAHLSAIFVINLRAYSI